LAIPWNANAKAGALVTINFLLSPEAQSRKGDLAIWGDPAVIQRQHLSGSASRSKLYPSIDEPHPSWQTALGEEWQRRYGHRQ
ncbi:ABC transporter substrate-binding protein, partial [Vibrio metschnikovii]|nr:ABC transporter substrate-binding protein [Vibrio metschnikovii]